MAGKGQRGSSRREHLLQCSPRLPALSLRLSRAARMCAGSAWRVFLVLGWRAAGAPALRDGVELAVTVTERDLARFPDAAARLAEISGYCAGGCAARTVVADCGGAGAPSAALRAALERAVGGGAFDRWRALDASPARVTALWKRTGGGSDAWPLLGGPSARPIASLPYFDMLDATEYAYLLHFDIDVSMRFAAGRPPRPWLAAATAVLAQHPRLLAAHPPAWQAREKLCAGRERDRCRGGRAFHTNWSLPVVGHATWLSARVFLMDVARYRSLHGRLRADCVRANRAAVAARTSDAFARFFDKTHGPGSANQHWEAYASCAALLAGFQRADLCGDWAVTWHDRDRDRGVRAPRKCFP